MANKQWMIHVAGATYRIQTEMERHLVFRISDDRKLGAFQHQPALCILESEVEPARLLEVAKVAQRTGRLPWTRADLPRQPTVQRPNFAMQTRRRRTARALTSLLMVLWPSA